MKNNQLLKTLAFSSLLSVLMVVIRIEWSGSLRHLFLVWNLFLAWIPFIMAELFKEATDKKQSRIYRLSLFLFWLVFFPNAPYLVTDLFHLEQRNNIPLWYDLVLIVSFAWNGLLLGFSSLIQVQKILFSKFSKLTVNAGVLGLIVLCSFGIYLGRYPRWNSWDIIANPFDLFSEIINMLCNPLSHTRMIGVTFFFSLFLMVSYSSLIALIKTYGSRQLPGEIN